LKHRGTKEAEDIFVRDYDFWFKTKVEKGLAPLDRGEFIEHAEVIARIEQILGTSKDQPK
jgi:predicted transcriptional regulator